jgi:hypothetical protein
MELENGDLEHLRKNGALLWLVKVAHGVAFE